MITAFDKTSVHFANLKFVAKAVNKAKRQGSRVNLNYIYCDGARTMATDRHRLHIYTPDPDKEHPLSPGYYEAIKNTKSELHIIKADVDYEYPDVDRIIPTDEGLQSFDAKGSLFGKFAQVIRSFDEGSINTDYFADALTGTDLFDGMFKVKDNLCPILLKGGFLTAVIMPTRS
jgi:hypothetical protein